MIRGTRGAACAALAAAVWLAALLPVAAAEGQSTGMPQLNPAVFAPQIIWLVIIFGGLYWLMSRTALPRVAAVLETRQQKIAGDLDRAAKLKEEAEAVRTAYEKALADARSQAQTLARQTQATLAAAATERQSRLAADLTRKIKDGEQAVASAKAAAMARIADAAADVARDVTSRVAGLSVSPAEAAGAASAALAARRS